MNCANHPDRERIAFCQNCGKPLCQECARTVGSAVFCEPCLAAKLSGTGTPPPAGTYTETPAGGGYTYTGNAGGVDFSVTGAVPPQYPPNAPNPGLAALLGMIPGVGAMYNGQYAKGVVHLIVFAILITLANENGIFGLFIAGWVCYQVIEAYHTARARRDGTPLPNPFGLNDLGERLGFGRSWPAGHPAAGAASTASTPVSGAPYNAPAAAYPSAAAYSSAAYPPPQAYAQNPQWESFVPPVPPVPPVSPYGAPVYPLDPNNLPVARNRFPAGALWLIGLGCIFLIGNAGIFHSFPIHRVVPFLLIGLGVWLFVHRMTDTGSSLSDDGTPGYQLRVFRALRGSIWVVLIGVLFLLDTFDILRWGHSWPLLVIVAGLMAIFQRATYSSVAAYTYPPVQPAGPPPAPAATIVPSSHDQEGN